MSRFFDALDLRPSGRTWSMVDEWTRSDEIGEGLKRDAHKAAFAWKERLAPDVRDRIRHLTEDVAGKWYSVSEWE